MRRFEPLDARAGAVHNNALAFVSDPPRRILVKEVNWLGDLVMSLPALRAIRRAWPDAVYSSAPSVASGCSYCEIW